LVDRARGLGATHEGEGREKGASVPYSCIKSIFFGGDNGTPLARERKRERERERERWRRDAAEAIFLSRCALALQPSGQLHDTRETLRDPAAFRKNGVSEIKNTSQEEEEERQGGIETRKLSRCNFVSLERI